MRHNSFRLLDPTKPAKYRNKKVELDGEIFDSKAECNRYAQLKLMAKLGMITDLRRQVPFELVPGVKIVGANMASPAIRYTADFVYMQDGKKVVEDCKGFITPVYIIKRHLMKHIFNIDIKETK